jgi:propanol-preferring alcohol dehydrogenase
MALADRVPIRTPVRTFRLGEANDALDALRSGSIEGVAVLVPAGNGR